MATTSKAVILSALLGAAVAGCGREAPEQTGAAGTSGTPPPASSTAGGTGATGTAPDTSSSTAGVTGGTSPGTTGAAGGADSSTAGSSSDTAAAGSTSGSPAPSPSVSTSSSGGSDTSSSSGASGPGAASSAGAVIDDSIITTKVKTALLADADIKGTDIVVETKKGEVQLSGFVRDKTQIDKAVKVASAIEGVKKVDNKMTVKQ